MKRKSNLITIVVMAILVTMFWQIDVAKSQVVTDGLLSYWTFDKADIAGQTAKDVWGDRDGTIIGDTQVSTGKNRDGLEFDGNGDYVEFDDSGLPEGNAPRTMSVWIKPEGVDTRSVLEWGTSVKTQRCAILVQPTQEIKFCGQNADVTSNGRVINGEWYHVTETYDGTTIRIYVDGVLDKEQAMSINTVLGVGRIGANIKQPSGEFFNGDIDEVSIYDRTLSAEEVAQNFASKIGPNSSIGSASAPRPADEATDVPRDVALSWEPGEYAATHDVYLGTVFGDVNDADRNNPLGVLASQDQDSSIYNPGRLEFGQTYYWRIDEVNAPPDDTIFKGNVWSFTTEPIVYPIENITGTASSANRTEEGPENTVNGSGLDGDDLHSFENTAMWLSSGADPDVAWIQYEFDKAYKLQELWVWNYNSTVEPLVGFGIKEATIEYSVDGANWSILGTTHEFAKGPGVPGYAPNTTVDLGGVAAKYVKITANSNWGGILNQYGLSEVRFFYIPVLAREPSPADGATDVSIGTIDKPTDTALDFRAGREAAVHNVYLGTDEQAVIDGIAPVTTVTETSYGPLSLDIGQTYYWRVDEVNDAETRTIWQGDIWNFATQEYFVLDDFEDYNDYPPDEIFSTWDDGYDDPANGSLIANPEPPFVETTIVHEGSQAMPYFYDNSVGYSEASVTLNSQRRDWTIRGIGSLSLWFRGYPASVGSFVEAPTGTYTMTASGADIGDPVDEFHYAYKELLGAGAIIAKVESVQNTHNWARVGVMIRDTVEADSAYAMMAVSANRGLAFDCRLTTGDITSRTRKAAFSAPYWVKIERDLGGNLTASYSSDGSAWTQLGTVPITMNAPMYVGLALTASNANAACKAVISNIQITGTANGPWINQDIGILSNAPEPMYVALANSGGTPAAVYHDDPNATQISTWTEWNIDLKGFADHGLDLTDVDKLFIGFGNRDNPQAGASGKMYFDDIRLYPLREP